jgi:hypothetical protein
VVETGKPAIVAAMSQELDPISAMAMTSIRTYGSSLNALTSIILFLIVDVTLAPTRTDPRNSANAARMIAFHSLRAREATEVAKL